MESVRGLLVQLSPLYLPIWPKLGAYEHCKAPAQIYHLVMNSPLKLVLWVQ